MLFSCSGVAVPPGSTRLEPTRFVTSRCLVVEFENHRNLDDKLRVGAAKVQIVIILFCFVSSG
jgi:hypothetical protein